MTGAEKVAGSPWSLAEVPEAVTFYWRDKLSPEDLKQLHRDIAVLVEIDRKKMREACALVVMEKVADVCGRDAQTVLEERAAAIRALDVVGGKP